MFRIEELWGKIFVIYKNISIDGIDSDKEGNRIIYQACLWNCFTARIFRQPPVVFFFGNDTQ